MTPEELAAIEARHILYVADPAIPRGEDDLRWCNFCDRPFPCDSVQLAIALREAEQVIRGQRNLIDALTGEPPPERATH